MNREIMIDPSPITSRIINQAQFPEKPSTKTIKSNEKSQKEREK